MRAAVAGEQQEPHRRREQGHEHELKRVTEQHKKLIETMAVEKSSKSNSMLEMQHQKEERKLLNRIML